ncbi:peptidoglycan DD-metalloendopeptidase family protein [Halobacillus litoralis]|uniref:peptidoglycan DD-metalloendopeptidase family protein n=1 Tax=Halobacillus litoralis TaxID=45668 RepID=UPI00136F3E89|nr:M23 family metallopeptidase [Halobacillus litoralis]MCA1021727.1 M23 family metallopeptidase [Halobacillus litoralis]MYL37311.1 peptidoglycan DD-metalloendopeptidase family protein [Halobacillus litoralis]
MNKNIRDVRRNIAGRKKKKLDRPASGTGPVYLPPQDEEAHGFPPLLTGDGGSPREPVENRRSSRIGLQVFFAVLLFGVMAAGTHSGAGLLKTPADWAAGQMEDEFPFAKVTAWYNDRFGDPLQVMKPKEDQVEEPLAMPVNGTVTTPFQNDGKGIILTTASDSKVRAVRDGTVVFAGNDPDSGKTVVLQHPDGTETTYGYLSEIDVYLYENVQAQGGLGSVKAEEGENAEFFFAIEKDDTYLDPVQVIKVNEGS